MPKPSKLSRALRFVFFDWMSLMTGGLTVFSQLAAFGVASFEKTFAPLQWLQWLAVLSAFLFSIRIAYRYAELTDVHLEIEPVQKEQIDIPTMSRLVRFV